MRHVLVVADETLVGSHVTKRIHELTQVEPLDVQLVVTAGPAGSDADIERATENLAAGLQALKTVGIAAAGRVGQADPMAAIAYNLKTNPAVNLVVLSTGPLGNSRWVAMDLPHRVLRRFDVAVEHIVGTPLDATPTAHVAATPVKVLLVEDDQHDIELATIALENLDTPVEILVARTGAHAVQYMAEASPRPDLVLLDLKMPVMDGLTMLEEFESTLGLDSLNELNIVVVSSSAADTDRDRAYALGAKAYVIKQPDFDEFQATLKSLVDEVVEHDVAKR
jgi:CheY-like chemotaxis protein